MKIAVIATIAVLLSGCADPPPPPRPQPATQNWQWRLNRGLNSLHGQNMEAAIAALGYPTSQQTIVGDRVLSWVSEFVFPATPDMGPLRVRCTIQIGVGEDSIIKNTHVDGTGCQHFANAFPR